MAASEYIGTWDQSEAIASDTGCVNARPFAGHPAGSIILAGVDWRPTPDGLVRITPHFRAASCESWPFQRHADFVLLELLIGPAVDLSIADA